MGQKRKREDVSVIKQSKASEKPLPGTSTFNTGKEVRDALASGSRQSLVAFHQEIRTKYSDLPLPITHPTVLILQHYLDVSPTCDEVFTAWRQGDLAKDERQAEAAVALLAEIIQILTALPFFRTSVVGLVKKLVSSTETYRDLLNRFINSGKREQMLLGLYLASVAANVDPRDPSSTSSGRLALGVWTVLMEGGTAKGLGKVLGMRRRNKERLGDYGDKDPLDRPDIRHACLHLILPLLSTSPFQAQAKPLLPHVYSDLPSDPPLTVYRVLTALWAAIIAPSSGIGRRVALSLLDENAIENLLRLVGREDLEPTSGRMVGEMTMAFLEGVTATPGQGVCFPDEGWYPRRGRDEATGLEEAGPEEQENGGVGDGRDDRFRKGLHNRILSNVVRRIGSKAVGDQGPIGDWVIKVLQACPEIVAGYWPHSGLALDPRLSARWMATMAYVGRIMSLPPPPLATFHLPVPRGSDLESMPPRAYPPSVATIIESILPSPITKQHLTKGLSHPDGLVQHMAALTLARGLQKLAEVQDVFRSIEGELDSEPRGSAENPWARRRRELEMDCRRRVPDILVVIAFAQKSATLARAHPDSDEEPDPALVAKSTMLTESALRLFGLYHQALPSIAGEARFDVGKLLVSASSVKAERRERRDARAGSVISDSGSVGSVGTVGTAGMGGGFGHARGDVAGFEALSQVHVLSLLGQVKDWNWSSKAAGSQYTYLYHILLLHLTTQHPVTKEMTTSLLNRLLLPSIMFEHDPGELEIWLSTLPRLPAEVDLSSRAMLLTQQIQLLSFLDDCFRRTSKTPYRYIEDSMSAVPDHFSPSRPHEMVSPVLMAILEQLHAKILGELISTEAAGVVLCWLRRVILGLSGKMKDGKFLEAVYSRLCDILDEAKQKGQNRMGLRYISLEIQAELRKVFQGSRNMMVNGDVTETSSKLIDEEEWNPTSIERAILDLDNPTARLPHHVKVLCDGTADSGRYRIVHFAVHLLEMPSEVTSTDALIDVIGHCLTGISERTLAVRGREVVFGSDALRVMLLGPSGNDHRDQLEKIVACLHLRDAVDRALADTYIRDLVEKASSSKQRKSFGVEQYLDVLQPWTRFLDPIQASTVLRSIAKTVRHLQAQPSRRLVETVSGTITAVGDAAVAFERFHSFLSLGIISPFSALLRIRNMSRNQSSQSHTSRGIKISQETLASVIEANTEDAFDLLETLIVASSSTARSFGELLLHDLTLSRKSSLLPSLRVLLELDGSTDLDRVAVDISNTAAGALTDQSVDARIHTCASEILVILVATYGTLVGEALSSIGLSKYNPSVARTVSEIAGLQLAGLLPSLVKCVNTGLTWAVRVLSNDAILSAECLETLTQLGAAINVSPVLELDGGLVEPVITAVVQERLTSREATDFAALLCLRCTVKASFVRQTLQLLFSSSIIASTTHRVTTISLIHALFNASPYASCQPTFLSSLLPLYQGTLSIPDKQILSLFQLFETHRKLSTTSLLNAWSPNGIPVDDQLAFETLTSLDAGKVFASCISFPLCRALRSGRSGDEVNEGLYDPAFILPLFASVLAEKLTGLDWVEVLRSNVIGLVVCSLSSRDAAMRALGRSVLGKSMELVERTPFQERPQLLYTLRLLRHSITTPPTRLPTLSTLFLAHSLRVLASPSHYLYPLTSRFLLQRPILDLYDVPMLYTMLYASDEGFRRERGWIVRLLRDGVRSDADWRILRRRHTFDLLATLYQSSVDISFRRLVLQAFDSMTRVPSAALSLTHRNNFISWLNMQWTVAVAFRNRGADEEEATYVRFVENVVTHLVAAEVAKEEHGDREKVWVCMAESFVSRACQDADPERLEVLARIALRLSAMPGCECAANLLPPLVKRMTVLDPTNTLGKVSDATIEHLFRASLSLEPQHMRQEVVEAVKEVGWRIKRLQREIGEWVRRETRRAEWDAMRSKPE